MNTPALGMSKRRLLFVNAVIAVLVVGQLFAMVVFKQPWPFAHYPMFAEARTEYALSKPQLYGVLQEEPHREIPLRGDYIQPFKVDRLQGAFEVMYLEPDPEKRQELLDEAARNSLLQYKRLRQAGRHDGPPLRGVRLYQLQWQLNPRADNVEHPDHRELLAEYEKPQEHP
jgi:hypothetical protein